MPKKPCPCKQMKKEWKEKKMAEQTAVETPKVSFYTISCFCGINRVLPDDLKVGDEFTLVPCPRCGNPLRGIREEDGVREIVG